MADEDGARPEPPVGTDEIGRRVGHYLITGVLGEGGMGVVYRATQERPQREVALKLVRSELAPRGLLRRFEHEAELLGRLSHPGIAQIHEAGIDAASGAPYFAMELVEGVPLTEYATRHALGLRERLALFAEVCRAVHHAHTRGVIHRDLKPSNILVTEVDDPPRPQPKVLDFGIARLTDSDTRSATLRTEIGQLLGTIPYMSPEQVVGRPDGIDTRSDVYALGVVLYELLAGRLPYDVTNRMIHEAALVIREEEPTRLSSVDARLRGDVETIVAKALEKERERRYQSADELATDIDRYLSDEPIRARPASAWYQLQKFSRRNRALVGGVVATFMALVAGLVASTTFALRAEERRVQAELAREAETDALREAQRAQREAVARAEELQLVASLQAEQLSAIDPPRMGLSLRAGLLDKVREAGERARLAPEEVEARVAELDRLLAGADFTGLALAALEENVFRTALDAIHTQLADQPLVRARLLQALAETTRELGLLELALGPQQEALELRLHAEGADVRDVLTTQAQLALLLGDRGDREGAERLQRDVLERRRALLGDDHPETLTAMHNLSTVLIGRNDLDAAETLLVECLERSQRVHGDEAPRTLSVYAELSVLRRARGRYAEAEVLLARALEGRKRALGEDHPQTLTAIANMGVLLRLAGRLEESEAWYRAALDGMRRAFGDDHPHTLMALNGVGSILLARGRLEEAEPYFAEVLERRRRLLGDDHPDTLSAISGQGLRLWQQGRLAEAEPFDLEAYEGFRRVLGERHEYTLTAMRNLGALRESQGRLAEAEDWYTRTLALQREALGDDHPNTLLTVGILSGVVRAQGRLAEAEPYYREALEGNRRVLGDEHPNTLFALHNMGVLLQEQGRNAEAEPYYRQAVEGRRRVLGAEHEHTLYSVGQLGEVLRLNGDAAAACALLEASEDAARRVWVDGNARWLGAYLMRLGAAQSAVGDREHAESSLLEAQDLLTAGFGASAPYARQCAALLEQLHDASSAAPAGAAQAGSTPGG